MLLVLSSITLTLTSTERVWYVASTCVVVLDVWYHHLLSLCITTVLDHSICSCTSTNAAAVVLHIHYVMVLCLCVAMLCVLVYAHCYMTYEVYALWGYMEGVCTYYLYMCSCQVLHVHCVDTYITMGRMHSVWLVAAAGVVRLQPQYVDVQHQ